MRKYLNNSAIQVYQDGSGTYGWNLFVADDVASIEGYATPSAAMEAALEEAVSVEHRYAQKDSQLAKIQAFIDAIRSNSIAECWMEPLPGNEAWIVRYLKDGEKVAATLQFKALRGWCGTAKWLDILIAKVLTAPIKEY